MPMLCLWKGQNFLPIKFAYKCCQGSATDALLSQPFWLPFSWWFAHLFWPWEGSNYPSRSRDGPNGLKGPKFKQNKKVPSLCHRSIFLFLPIPVFVSFIRHSPSPKALCNPGMVDVVHRVRDRPRVAPRNWESHWPAGLEPGREHWRLTLAKTVLFHTGDAISSRSIAPPPPLILYPMSLQWHEWVEIASIPQKNILLCPRSISSPSTPLATWTWWTSSLGYVADFELPSPSPLLPELVASSGWRGAS